MGIFEQWKNQVFARGLNNSDLINDYRNLAVLIFESISSGFNESEGFLESDLIDPTFKNHFNDVLNKDNEDPSKADQIGSFLLECKNSIQRFDRIQLLYGGAPLAIVNNR